MTQLSDEQQERLKQIREIVGGPNFYYQGQFYKSRDDQQFLGDALLLLQETFSLLDSDSQAASGFNKHYEDLMRAALLREQSAATAMRDKCVGELLVMKAEHIARGDLPLGRKVFDDATKRLSSLTLYRHRTAG